MKLGRSRSLLAKGESSLRGDGKHPERFYA